MLFDSCRAHTFKIKPYAALCSVFPDGHEFNNIYCLFSQILTVSPSRFAGLFYCSLLITVFASLTVVNVWGEIKDFVAMN